MKVWIVFYQSVDADVDEAPEVVGVFDSLEKATAGMQARMDSIEPDCCDEWWITDHEVQ
jgi:hypothetical protein